VGNGHKVILSLCDRTGNWPAPYREAGYDVRMIDLATTGEDVRLLPFPGRVHGVLCAPPCTVFARSGAWVKRTDDEMRLGLSVVDACLRLAVACRPAWWCLENPAGSLKRYIGPWSMTFNPCDFGDSYTKRTCLWGVFTPPVAGSMFTTTRPVEPTLGSIVTEKMGGGSERKGRRSATPPGFARAFFEANP
jgi:hypothetical protein